MRAVLDALRPRTDEMASFLAEIVAMDSPSGEKALVDRLGARLASAIRERGGKVDTIAQDEVGDHLLGRWDGSGAEPVLIVAHMDTVWPADETSRRPPLREDGVLRGPGSFDMKAGVTQALFAIEALRSLRITTPPIELMITSDEEMGSKTSRAPIEEAARRARAVFVVEPASDGGALKTARKGIGMYRITVEGVASHAGLDPEKGRSAILELAHQTVELHALTDLARGVTVNVGVVSGGSGRNVIPANAIAEIDLRVMTAEQADELHALIMDRRPHGDGTKVRVEGGINRPPMERDAGVADLFERAQAVATDLGIGPLGEVLSGGGSDGNFTAALGVPTLDGLGAVGGGAHALNEHVIEAAMPERAALLAGIVASLAD